MSWQVLAHYLSQPTSLALVALLLERLIPWSPAYHPLTLVTLLCKHLPTRVLKPQRDTPATQLLAGLLTTLLLATLILLPSWWFRELSEFPLVIGTIILWMGLSYKPQRQLLKSGRLALVKGQKNLARDRLRKLDPRDTQNLSPVGLTRAFSDLALLLWIRQQLTPVIGFLIAGPIVALGLRLLHECTWQWPPQHPRFAHFGRFANVLARLAFAPVQWLVALLFIPLALMQPRTKHGHRRQGWSVSERWMLSSVARALHQPMGGPIAYNGTRIQRARFGVLSTHVVQQHIDFKAALLGRELLFLALLLGLLSASLTQFFS